MNSAHFSSDQNGISDRSTGDLGLEQELLTIEDVIEQDNVALLQSQLAAAHHMLQYQQQLVHSLTEQMQIKDMHLQHAERQVDDLQQHCQSQTVELAEMRSICADLRSLLKRQTHRAAPAPSVSQAGHSLGFEVPHARTVHTSVSFGYESVAQLTPEAQRLTKAPPVQAWSAPQTEEIREEITFCQKLTTFIVSSNACLTPAKTDTALDFASQAISLPERQSPKKSPKMRSPSPRPSVELPRFALG